MELYAGSGGQVGIHLWSLGYATKPNQLAIDGQVEIDDEEDDSHMDEAEARSSFDLMKGIFDDDYTISESILPDEMKTISGSGILRQAYNDRWYRYDNNDTYLVAINYGPRPLQPGSEVAYPYRNKGNGHLLEK